MAVILALILCLVLMIIAAIHFYWGMGGVWPAADEPGLERMVVGTQTNRMPGRTITLLVAVCLIGAALVPLVFAGVIGLPLPQILLTLAMVALTGVFLGRGLLTYSPLAAKMHGVEPFSRLDRAYYAPLCIALGSGFAVLAFLVI